MSASTVELTLTGKSPLKRSLMIRVTNGGAINAALYAIAPRSTIHSMLAWASGEVLDSKVRACYGGQCLWIGRAAFDVSPAEAEELRAKFGPLGLRFETDEGLPRLEESAAGSV